MEGSPDSRICRVLIVEDEEIERKALELALRRELKGLVRVKSVGDASSFEREVYSFRPHVVLLDIRIPGGDGLNKLRDLRMQGFDFEVVVITAFDVFEYAQSAVELGVSHFLVKPISDRKLLEAVSSSIKVAFERERAAWRMGQIGDLLRDHGGVILGWLLKRASRGTSFDVNRWLIYELGIGKAPFYLLVVALEGGPEVKDVLCAWQILQRELCGALVIPWNDQMLLLLVPSVDEGNQEEISLRALSLISGRGVKGNVIWVGSFGDVEELVPLLPSLEEVAEESVLQGFGRVVIYEEFASARSRVGVGFEEGFSLPQDRLGRLMGRLEEGFLAGDTAVVSEAVSELGNLIAGVMAKDEALGKLLMLGVFGALARTFVNMGCDLNLMRGWAQRVLLDAVAPLSPVEAQRVLYKDLSRAWTVRASATDADASLVYQAVSFIKSNCDTVTLQSVAEHVHVSPAHLSRLFRRVLRKRFIDVVKEERVERAKVLLKQGLSVKDVALHVGYGNISHFSLMFKSLTGMSPSEYAASRGQA